ncbi:rna pseudouridylate synthase domain-containing protein 2-like [Stylonychia lemnae]|uniref:Rna pseudouridylate synthase domain-containing protein 2-like n=1 Tax=Stylonychia lemnae TaxID=5949 RepID=A0A077ZML9_STYLE|nr:rna pseudouridylate synthase domain-containing protein 2-like [Stylonychia lemnae]|eukprot:CDW71183.1 rna pseudouridylate synthase domain-containing protein 2-like [Stylonychia lemnae]
MNVSKFYYFKNGMRFVHNYKHEYIGHAKKRWVDQGLLDVYRKEFLSCTPQYYESAIIDGRITVNGQKVKTDYLIRENDKIVHAVIRKEPPVIDQTIDIIYQDKDLVAVDKPASMPVHEGGSYKHNSLLSILENDYNLKGLKTVHRLDRQTSGIVFFAKNVKATNEFRTALDNDQVQKIYYARVLGNFKQTYGTDEVEVNKWVYTENFKLVLQNCADELDLTEETRKTAKTHQIRVHLKALGHPIANDVIYGGKYRNNCIENQFTDEDFEDVYQNKTDEKDYLFLILWLHAYKYTYKDISAKTKKPCWAETDFKL